MGSHSLLVLALVLYASAVSANDERDGKLVSLFNVVRFQNKACDAGSNRNGTCYTEQECEDRNGEANGSCAEGFGVCCYFDVGCGQSSSENNTYFVVTGPTASNCNAKVCPCSDNICQLRLDFNTFTIAGPVTVTTQLTKAVNGQTAPGATKSVSTATQCSTDTFSVVGAGPGGPPTICGTNTGEHMYVPMKDGCVDLNFALGAAGVSMTVVPSRSWNIQVTQYDCNYNNLAPEGCTQYFFNPDATTGTVQTFNYDGNAHLADQNQNICVRQERGTCKACWSAVTADDVQVSGKNKGLTMPCCSYGAAGTGKLGYDCISIPGAEKTDGMDLASDKVCGHKAGLVTQNSKDGADAHKTICNGRAPFSVRFISDHWESGEADGEAMADPMIQKGFKLNYKLQSCTT